MKKTVKILALLIAVTMMLSLAACGSSSNKGTETQASTTASGTTAAAQETTEPAKEPVTIELLIYQTTVPEWNENHDTSPVQQEIKRVTGVTLEQKSVDDNQLNVILASGDLPDMIRIDQSKFGKALIEGNHVIALDQLLQTNGQELLKNIPESLAYSKAKWSQGKDQTYFVPVNIGPDTMGMVNTTAPILRWDYYKEIGAPEFNNEIEMLQVIKQMQEKHPTTPEGKKVYGVSMWNDWGTWSIFQPMYYFTGYGVSVESTAQLPSANPELVDVTTADEPYWRGVKFYYTANQMGLLDPDAFTMKYDDFVAKATAGQLLYGPADWPFDGFNQQNNKDKKGYMAIPMNAGYQWHGNMGSMGMGGKHFAITADCKNPERAMDLMNYFWSPDGCRTLYNGVKGVHWDMVDGKPMLKEETIAAYKLADDAWKATNINYDYNVIGLSPYFIHPEDGEPLCLFNSAQVYKTALNPLMEDYSAFYGVSYPAEIFKKKLDEGKNLNRSEMNPFLGATPYDRTDELKRIEANLKDLLMKYAAKCTLAKNDDEFEKFKAEAIKEFEKAGSKQNFEARKQWLDFAKEDSKNYWKR